MRVKLSVLLMLLMSAWVSVAQADPVHDLAMIVPQTRMLAPDFSLPASDGVVYQLSSFRGKMVLLHFWATWCGPCRKEMPQLLAVRKELLDHGIVLLLVNVNQGGSSAVEHFLHAMDEGSNTLLDSEGDVRNAYAVRALPTTYLIGPDGKFSGLMMGARDWSKAMPVLLQFIEHD